MFVVEGCEGGLVLQQLSVRNVHTDWTELPHILYCLESQSLNMYRYRPQSTYKLYNSIYLEYHSVCPLVRIVTLPPPFPLASVSPPVPKGGGRYTLACV